MGEVSHGGSVRAVAWSPCGAKVATGCGGSGREQATRVIDAASGAVDMQINSNGFVRALAWDPTGKRLATGSDDGLVASLTRRKAPPRGKMCTVGTCGQSLGLGKAAQMLQGVCVSERSPHPVALEASAPA